MKSLYYDARSERHKIINWFNNTDCYTFPCGTQFQWQNLYKSNSENYSALSWRPPAIYVVRPRNTAPWVAINVHPWWQEIIWAVKAILIMRWNYKLKKESLGKQGNTDISCSVFTTFKPKVNFKILLTCRGWVTLGMWNFTGNVIE